METKDIIYKLRIEKGLSQDSLAEKVFVTRQAVSRWETGETTPSIETLKLLSKLFNVSINTLLGSPSHLICQCCGMPIDDDSILSHNLDGSINENYCKWCYADGVFTYHKMSDLIDVCVKNMVNENYSEQQARIYLEALLPNLDYWKRYEELSDNGEYELFKQQLIDEINNLDIDGLEKIDKLYPLVGKYVNLNYRLPNGIEIQFLDDDKTYLGTQVPCKYDADYCFGIVADMDFILICTYKKDGINPELIRYIKR